MTTLDQRSSTRLVIESAMKRYGNTQALSGLSLVANSGEITGVAGPNGAGKSTLVKALAGEVELDSGSILFGRADDVARGSVDGSTRRARVAVVHQETSLFPNLTVAENLAAARPRSGWRAPRTTAADLQTMESLGILQHRAQRVAECSLVVRQLTEIARALVLDEVDILLLDEPNSALTEEESSLLFERVLEIKQRNQVVLLVTHRLNDLVRYCDRVAIVRDGRVATKLAGESLSERQIAKELVVGLEIAEKQPGAAVSDTQGSPSRKRLVVSQWRHKGAKFNTVDFACAAGEITAIVGSEGSGARELLRSLGGFDRASGTCEVDDDGRVQKGFSSQYMPAERQVSLFSNLDCRENLVARLGIPLIASRGGWLRSRAIREIAGELFGRFRVRGGSLSASVRSFSGGNQQKVAIASAAAAQPDVLLLEEPTRGVDLASKTEIYRLLIEYAGSGRIVVAFCSELPEVFEVANRVLVVEAGEIVASHDIAEFSSVTDLAHAVAEATSSTAPRDGLPG